MNVRWSSLLGTVGAASVLALAGCSAGVGGAATELAYVSSDVSERTDLYIDRSIAERPMTLEQLGLDAATVSTVPVEVEVFGHVAVAWARHGDAEIIRNRANIVGLWHVIDTVNAHTTAGRVDDVSEGPIYVEQPNEDGALDVSQVSSELNRQGANVPAWHLIQFRNRTSALENLRDAIDEGIVRELTQAHPGC